MIRVPSHWPTGAWASPNSSITCVRLRSISWQSESDSAGLWMPRQAMHITLLGHEVSLGSVCLQTIPSRLRSSRVSQSDMHHLTQWSICSGFTRTEMSLSHRLLSTRHAVHLFKHQDAMRRTQAESKLRHGLGILSYSRISGKTGWVDGLRLWVILKVPLGLISIDSSSVMMIVRRRWMSLTRTVLWETIVLSSSQKMDMRVSLNWLRIWSDPEVAHFLWINQRRKQERQKILMFVKCT